MVGGLKKVRPEIQIHFNEKVKKKREYKDKFTKKYYNEIKLFDSNNL